MIKQAIRHIFAMVTLRLMIIVRDLIPYVESGITIWTTKESKSLMQLIWIRQESAKLTFFFLVDDDSSFSLKIDEVLFEANMPFFFPLASAFSSS